ncbi:MFS transporter [Paenibacillus lutrae]|uniref:MFS transporter n=1 Tax=Paenibacillus lutrae TaxID=2078573 RepID=A0A7X3FLG0_9BACL|nr:MFS transporter [Paenibacillus lutrae]MVP01886.1 MFS transporter [Paenibacillus lutrae]
MNKKVYLFAIASFVVGAAELILGGILDLIADALRVPLSKAGLLISIFSLVYAVSAPVVLTATAKVERKKVYMWSLVVFLLSNILAAASMNYTMLFLSRILAAASGSSIIILSTTLAARIVKPEYQGRAIGVVFMGISASLVLGIPLGIYIGNNLGWREVFAVIAILTGIIIAVMWFTMDRMQPTVPLPLKQQLKAVRGSKMVAIHLTTLFVLAGHLTLYAYFTPFLQETFGLSSNMVMLVYGIFGIAAVAGGGLGGVISDKWNPAGAVVAVISLFLISMAVLPLAVNLPFAAFLVLMIVWSALSWAVSAVQNNLIIHSSPENSEILISTNSAITHLGISIGSYVGGLVIQGSSVLYNGWAGSIFVLLGLICSLFAVTRQDSISSQAESSLKA